MVIDNYFVTKLYLNYTYQFVPHRELTTSFGQRPVSSRCLGGDRYLLWESYKTN
jgi:hypothetical protein